MKITTLSIGTLTGMSREIADMRTRDPVITRDKMYRG